MLVRRVSGVAPEPSAFITHKLKAVGVPLPPSRRRDDRKASLFPSGDQTISSAKDPSMRCVNGLGPDPSTLANQILPALFSASLPSRARDDTKAIVVVVFTGG